MRLRALCSQVAQLIATTSRRFDSWWARRRSLKTQETTRRGFHCERRLLPEAGTHAPLLCRGLVVRELKERPTAQERRRGYSLLSSPKGAPHHSPGPRPGSRAQIHSTPPALKGRDTLSPMNQEKAADLRSRSALLAWHPAGRISAYLNSRSPPCAPSGRDSLDSPGDSYLQIPAEMV
jgi:hypothetical protein